MRVVVDANTILSGLFFRGNERKLLLASLHGSVVLIFAEDVVNEVYAVIAETFREHADLPCALELLGLVFGAGELVSREVYRARASSWADRLRDATDAPMVACGLEMEAQGLVTGDRDLLDLGEVGGIRVYRTRELLELLAQRN